MVLSHNYSSKPIEQCALQWFGKVVSQHLVCGAVCNFYFFLLYPVLDEEVSYVNVFGATCARYFSVGNHFYRTLVVLVHHVVVDWVSLFMEKHSEI